jgi:hypothetical protein
VLIATLDNITSVGEFLTKVAAIKEEWFPGEILDLGFEVRAERNGDCSQASSGSARHMRRSKTSV